MVDAPTKIPSLLSVPFGRLTHAASVQQVSSISSPGWKLWIRNLRSVHFIIDVATWFALRMSPSVLFGMAVNTSTEWRKSVWPQIHDIRPNRARSSRFSWSAVRRYRIWHPGRCFVAWSPVSLSMLSFWSHSKEKSSSCRTRMPHWINTFST